LIVRRAKSFRPLSTWRTHSSFFTRWTRSKRRTGVTWSSIFVATTTPGCSTVCTSKPSRYLTVIITIIPCVLPKNSNQIQSAQSEPNYASLFRGRPKRFVLPLKPERGYSGDLNESCNLSASEAYWLHPGGSNDDNVIVIRPDELCLLGCETPTVNYATYNGRPYRYFYAISSDVDADNPGTVKSTNSRKQQVDNYVILYNNDLSTADQSGYRWENVSYVGREERLRLRAHLHPTPKRQRMCTNKLRNFMTRV